MSITIPLNEVIANLHEKLTEDLKNYKYKTKEESIVHKVDERLQSSQAQELVKMDIILTPAQESGLKNNKITIKDMFNSFRTVLKTDTNDVIKIQDSSIARVLRNITQGDVNDILDFRKLIQFFQKTNFEVTYNPKTKEGVFTDESINKLVSIISNMASETYHTDEPQLSQ